ncbi:MAG: VCBS repeat-containing protein [Gemmatimonadetes bacterium]|nr:VCBS repeat-containing protein [Gemmatimonadota bacterium]
MTGAGPKRTAAWLTGAAALIGCVGGGGNPAALGPGPRAGAGTFEYQAAPFPVRDSTGRAVELPFLGGLNIPRPQLADLDGDGHEDLIIQEYSGAMLWLARDGSDTEGLPHYRYRTSQYQGIDVGEWSRFVDVDGDGDLDLFAEWPSSYIRMYRNVGSRAVPRYQALADTLRDASGAPIFADRQNIAQFVDIDCNAKVDLFIGRIQGTILHYEIVDPGAAVPRFRLVSDRFQDLEIITGQGSMHGANTMAFVDHDVDGDLDLFWGDFFEAGLLLFENAGSCREPRLRREPVRFPADAPLVTSGYNAPAFSDLDGDGRLDLVVGVLGGSYDPIKTTIANLHLFTRTPAGGWVHRREQLLSMIDVGSEAIPSLADTDGDGDLDLYLANKIEPFERQTSRIYRFENVGTARAPAFAMRGSLPIRGRYHQAPAWGDLDGDGDFDLVLGSYGAAVGWWRNDGTKTSPRWVEADSALVRITRGSNTTPALGDLDGDGDLDLLIGEASGTLNLYRNEGTASAPRFVLISDEYGGIDVGRRSVPALVDLDGDGDLDLLMGSDDQGLVLFRNQGSRSEARFVADSGFRVDVPVISAPAAADLDGDGRVDLIVGTSGGGAVYFRGR